MKRYFIILLVVVLLISCNNDYHGLEGGDDILFENVGNTAHHFYLHIDESEGNYE